MAERSVKVAILAVGYCITGALGLSLALPPGYATAVWPPSGIAVAALLYWGPRVWPGVWLGSFLVNLWVTLSFPGAELGLTSLAIAGSIALGSTLQALLGAFLLQRFVGKDRIFESGPTVVTFAALASLFCLLAPTWGVTTLDAAGLVDVSAYSDSWRTWWLGDVIGVLVVAPVLLSWPQILVNRRPAPRAEAVAALSLLAATTILVFFGPSPRRGVVYAPSFLPLPCLVWIAFRFSPRAVALANFLLSTIAVSATSQGTGPFAFRTTIESLALLQTFTGVATLMALTLAAAVAGQRQSEAALRKLNAEMEQLALTDELTGLRNRRGFLLLAEQGLLVARRSGAKGLLVFVDLDGLKLVNDSQGHKAGDSMIIDAARVLTSVFRKSDVVARVGGDEFAVLALVDAADTSVAMRQRLQSKIDEFNREGRRTFQLSMSVGIEELSSASDYSLEALISQADHAMYQRKREETQRRSGETKRPGPPGSEGVAGS